MLLAASCYPVGYWKNNMMNHAGVILEQISDRYLLSIEAHRQSVLL